MRTIALPKHKTLTASLEQCLQNRRSCREMSEKELSDEDLGWGAKFGPEGSSIIGSPSGNPE